MVKLLIDYTDGHYATRLLTEEQVRNLAAAKEHEAVSRDIVEVEDAVYRAWLAHLDQRAVFDTMWRGLDSFNRPPVEVARVKRLCATEWTCLYPQPGCALEMLDHHPEWRARAEEILAEYKPERGLRQGCCCEHTHVKLSDHDAAAFRAAGFVVEHDAEYDDVDR